MNFLSDLHLFLILMDNYGAVFLLFVCLSFGFVSAVFLCFVVDIRPTVEGFHCGVFRHA